MSNKIAKDALNVIHKKTGKKITDNQIKKLANKVKPTTLQDEDQLRNLIEQVAAMANISVSKATIQDIVNTVRKSGIRPQNLESLINMLKT